MSCLFCRIVAGEIPAKKVYEDKLCLAFHDIDPKAPVHLLIIPKKHIASVSDIFEEDKALAGHLLYVAGIIARDLKLEDGYRVVSNIGELAGQSVPHLHFHLLSGRSLSWPPG